MSRDRLAGPLSPRRLFSNRLFKGFSSMSAGTLAGQAITLLALPLISRLYSPEDFGVLSLVIAASAMVLPAVGLKFEYAILLPDSRREMRGLVGLALASVVVLSTIWSEFAQLASTLFVGHHHIQFFGLWIFGITAASGLFNVFIQIAIRERNYNQVGASAFIQSSSTAVSQTAFGAIQWSYPGLLSGVILGQVISLSVLARRFRFDLGRFSARDIPRLWRKHWRFPAVFAPSAILNSIGLQLPLIAISAIFGLNATGQIGMAERIVAIPIALIGGPIGQLFVGEISKMRRESHPHLVSFYLRITAVLMACSVILFGLLIVLAPWLIPVVLGNQWASSVPLIQIISIMGAIRLSFSPTAMALTIFQRARANVILDFLRLGLVALGIAAVTFMHPNLNTSTLILYGGLSISYIVTWVYVLWMLHQESRTDAPIDG